jgi:predicted neuraminidase
MEGFPSCHASTIVECKGDLIAAWYGGAAEGHPDSANLVARKPADAKAWDKPFVVAKQPGRAHGNPRLFLDPKGDVRLIYAVNFGKWCEGGSKLFERKSGDGGKKWSSEREIECGAPLLGKNKPIVLMSGEYVLPVEDEVRWQACVLISTDRCESWIRYGDIAGESGEKVIQPTAAQLRDGSILMLLRTNVGRIYETRSFDRGRGWTPATPTILSNPNSGIDMVRMRDGRLALVYNDSPQNWGPRTPLCLALSEDEGRSWQEELRLEQGPGEYSYPAIIQTSDGRLHVTYTWRRERIKHVVIGE